MAYAKNAPAFIEAKMETSRPNIFEEPRVPSRPSSPNMSLNVFIGTFLGAAAAVAIIFIQFVSDDRVRNAEMLHKRLGLATLGMMPMQDSGNGAAKVVKTSKNHKHHTKGAKKA
jgi:capsular polysaccharide biosynthesis protein